MLLNEVHHRVKNNLQLVSSLLALQARGVQQTAQRALIEGQRRIDSIALVHEQLYGSRNLSVVNLARYVEALVTELCRASGLADRVELVCAWKMSRCIRSARCRVACCSVSW